MTDPRPAAPSAPYGRKTPFRRWLLTTLTVIGLAAGLLYGALWWREGRFLESTNDAYLRADLVSMAPKVSGYVEAVLVTENQPVRSGQPLVRIDARDYRAALLRQRAAQAARGADIAVARAQLEEQRTSVEQARARLAGTEEAERFATREEARYRRLVADGAENAQRLAQAAHDRAQAQASRRADAAALEGVERQFDILRARLDQARAQEEAARAQVREAELSVDDTLIRAPLAGRVGDRGAQLGQYVQAGTRLMSVVPVEAIYAVANFKETQLARMRAGQKARLAVDALDGRILQGEVESFAPGTGGEFALLPPENATGNFTKIVQRVPVRIRLHADPELLARLIPGLSVTVTVDTRAAGEPR